MPLDLRPSEALGLWHAATLEHVRVIGPDLTIRQLAILLHIYLAPPPHTARGLAAMLGVTKPVTLDVTFNKAGAHPFNPKKQLIGFSATGTLKRSEFGMNYAHQIGEPSVMTRFKAMGLVPHWDRARFEDSLAGRRNEIGFEFFEAELKQRRRSSSKHGSRTRWVTVFQGQCLVAHFPKPFQGSTRAYRDAGIFNGLVKLGHSFGKHEKVALEDPKFERAFEVYSTDQVEARFLLTPDFMERLLNLEAAFHGKKLRCGFSGGEMFVAVEGGNLFEAGSMYRPMDDLARVREILLDFAATFLLIDAMGERYTPDQLRGPSA